MPRTKLQKQNDIFRKKVIEYPQDDGQCVVGAALMDLEDEKMNRILKSVKEFSDFGEDNDPWDEHDMGIVELSDIPKIMWKIDYYADKSCTFGAEEPEKDCYRILTIIFASDY